MIIVKIGGAKGILYDIVLADVASLVKEGKQMILVHGGKNELEDVAVRLGKSPQWVTTDSGFVSRRTDKETMDLFTMVYAGKMNKMIVEKLQQFGVNALGLSGLDGRLLVAKKKNIIAAENGRKKILRDDYTGKLLDVNKALLTLLLEQGYFPVICPPAISEENEALNVDGDRVAALLAETFSAETVVYLSNVPGLLQDKNDERTLIRHLDKKDLAHAMKFAEGTMKKKVLGALEALNGGVRRVIFSDARVPFPLRNALQGNGTVIE